MGRNISIIVGALIVAAALVYVLRWDLVVSGDVYRLDRWTGKVTHCDDQWVQVKPIPAAPVEVDCKIP